MPVIKLAVGLEFVNALVYEVLRYPYRLIKGIYGVG
ncbi:hypothetical protein ES708_06768 [subsurface metagenome]